MVDNGAEIEPEDCYVEKAWWKLNSDGWKEYYDVEYIYQATEDFEDLV